MSKMDALRAMREAKYEAAQKTSQKAGAKAPQARTRPPVAPPTTTPVSKAKPAKSGTTETSEEPGTAPAEALCGHRNMSGRTCTREHGHAAKSHRYSS